MNDFQMSSLIADRQRDFRAEADRSRLTRRPAGRSHIVRSFGFRVIQPVRAMRLVFGS